VSVSLVAERQRRLPEESRELGTFLIRPDAVMALGYRRMVETRSLLLSEREHVRLDARLEEGDL
jgi:hypothetical protein